MKETYSGMMKTTLRHADDMFPWQIKECWYLGGEAAG
jgi:hypothetical protein